jgi:hypothetical protein
MMHVHPHDALADPLPFVMRDTSSRPVGCSGLPFRELNLADPDCSCLLDVARSRQDGRNSMTAPRVGETFHLDLDGTAIAGRYIEVDPPHRMLLRWDRQGTDTATPTPTFVEITLTPMGDGTNVRVQFSGLSAEDAAFYPQLWARHLDRIAAAFAGAEPAHGN